MISGGCKFFLKSKCLYKEGSTVTASSNNGAAKNILDSNKYTQWISVGSNDTTTETLIILLPTTVTINRLFLTEFNFKDFEVKYWNGSAYVSFTNVVGANGTTYSGILSTSYSLDSAYFEFDSIGTSRLKIIINKTQVANAEKFLCNLIATEEIGTLLGFPVIDPINNNNEISQKTLSGKHYVTKGFQTTQIKMNFKTHPYQEDNTLIETLFDSPDPFLVYPCGGRTGTQYFKISQKAWTLKDVFNMQLVGLMDSGFEKGIYIIGVNKNITFEEHI